MQPRRNVNEIATGRWPNILAHFGVAEKFLTAIADAIKMIIEDENAPIAIPVGAEATTFVPDEKRYG